MTITTLKQSDIRRCPYVIMMPSHYRPDGTCRCNDPTHTEMKAWGYHWQSDLHVWSHRRPPRKPKKTTP